MHFVHLHQYSYYDILFKTDFKGVLSVPISEARKRANAKWNLANLASITIKLKKEDAERFKRAATAAGTTPTAILKQAYEEFMQKHNDITE